MRKISIENLGPIDGKFEISLDQNLTILIGEQATGKSTIARMLYYCTILATNERMTQSGSEDYFRIPHIDTLRQYFRRTYSSGDVLFFDDSLGLSVSVAGEYSTKRISTSDLSDERRGTIYIPAGRSTIPLLFESYAAVKNINVDPFFDDFLLFLDGHRREYHVSLQDMLTDNVEFSESQIDIKNAKAAIGLIEKILKGKYRYEKGNERIFYGNDVSVPIVAASSGQQEILYILMTLYYVLLHPKPYTVIIEEPEAHIFPMAQKLIMELVARVINATDSHIVITTHSPYILTSANLLMHSAKVENRVNDTNSIVEPMERLRPEEVSAFLLERNGDFSYRSIVDSDTGLIAAEEIDKVSEIIDKGIADLIDLEVKHGL